MLRKIKAIAGLAILAALGGLIAYISGVDWNEAFGPSYGAIAAAVVGYLVKESYPKMVDYIAKAFGSEQSPPKLR